MNNIIDSFAVGKLTFTYTLRMENSRETQAAVTQRLYWTGPISNTIIR